MEEQKAITESATPASPPSPPTKAAPRKRKPAPSKKKEQKQEPAASPTADQREGYLGGSDAAALLGLSPYATPMQVFAQKTGRDIKLPHDPNREALFYFGHRMEPVIARAVTDHYGIKLQPHDTGKGDDFRRSKQYPWMGGHVDFFFATGKGFLECKNVRYPSAWGDMMPEPLTADGSHLIPSYYLCQCLHYMVVLESDHCYLAALIGGCELRIYLITRERNAPLIDELIRVEREFWERCVLPDDPPAPLQPADLILRKGIFPEEPVPKNQLLLDPKLQALFADLEAARAMAAAAERKADAARNAIILAAAGPAEFVDGMGNVKGRVTIASKQYFDAPYMRQHAPVAFSIYELCFKDRPYFLVKGGKDTGEEK